MEQSDILHKLNYLSYNLWWTGRDEMRAPV